MKSFRDAILLPIYYSYLPEHRDPMDRFLSMNSAIEEYKLPLLVCMAVMAARELARDKEGAITNHM